jgi:APA family basic amino acid/polyamine antiporter
MVVLKLVIIAFFLGIGAFYVTPENWTPFAPNGFATASAGAAAIIFFAYIGFDAVSTAAEESIRIRSATCRSAMIGSLVICTVIYMAVAIVLTGHGAVERSSAPPSRWPPPSRAWG